MPVVEGGLLCKDGWTSEQNKTHKVKYHFHPDMENIIKKLWTSIFWPLLSRVTNNQE